MADLYHGGQKDDLREFLKLAGDKAALADLDRRAMGQTTGVELTEPPTVGGRRG